MLHRLAHRFYTLQLPLIPRLVSHISRMLTGIDIHPGAVVGKGVFIDHGMGVVIGETAILGDYCLIYQGVTLGGTGKETGKRHPTLGENVVVGAGAKVLGNLQIGNNVRVGAGSVVLRDVPSDCTVVGVPGRIVYRSGEKTGPLEHGRLPDSEAQVIRLLLDRIEVLEQQVQTLTHQMSTTHAKVAYGTDIYRKNHHLAHADSHLVKDSTSLATSEASIGSETMSISSLKTTQSCQIKDKVIEQFLDSSEI